MTKRTKYAPHALQEPYLGNLDAEFDEIAGDVLVKVRLNPIRQQLALVSHSTGLRRVYLFHHNLGIALPVLATHSQSGDMTVSSP